MSESRIQSRCQKEARDRCLIQSSEVPRSLRMTSLTERERDKETERDERTVPGVLHISPSVAFSFSEVTIWFL